MFSSFPGAIALGKELELDIKMQLAIEPPSVPTICSPL
ncbi:MAG: hypothetical protein RIQ99_400 [Pseudomonadota bacterium]|jgi:hypothetical protein